MILAPESTASVRRSSRCNNYDGFNDKNMSNDRPIKSKVKTRKMPYVKLHAKTAKPEDDECLALIIHDGTTKEASTDPAATPVPMMQSIAVNLYGVPPEEVSIMKLLASPEDGEDPSCSS